MEVAQVVERQQLISMVMTEDVHNIQLWAQYNHLKLNCAKCSDVIFSD